MQPDPNPASAETQVLRGVADVLGLAMIAVAPDRRVLFGNAVAEAILARSDGLSTRRQILQAATPAQTARLAAAVGRACVAGEAAAHALRVARVGDRPPYLLTITPLRAGTTGAAAIFLRDPDRPASVAAHLEHLFDLTPAEAAVAACLGQGLRAEDVCALRGVSIHTVRVQVKSIAAKMGVSRQTEIVALVASLPPLR